MNRQRFNSPDRAWKHVRLWDKDDVKQLRLRLRLRLSSLQD